MTDEKSLWQMDDYGVWNLRTLGPDGHPIHAWIGPRPVYCDRGRFQANVMGIPDIDGADGFARFYMDLETAKREMEAWVMWRLYRRSPEAVAAERKDTLIAEYFLDAVTEGLAAGELVEQLKAFWQGSDPEVFRGQISAAVQKYVGSEVQRNQQETEA